MSDALDTLAKIQAIAEDSMHQTNAITLNLAMINIRSLALTAIEYDKKDPS